MNFIGRHIQLIGVLLLTAFIGSAGAFYFEVPRRIQETYRGRQSRIPGWPQRNEAVEAHLTTRCARNQGTAGCNEPGSACCTHRTDATESSSGHECVHAQTNQAPSAINKIR